MPAPRPIHYIIFASPKSGTEWLRRMLGAHRQVHCAETRPFGDFFDPANPTAPHLSLQKYASFLATYHAPGADPARFERALTARLWRQIAAAAREATGKPIYGEKITPFDGTAREVVRRLAEFDPQIRFVHLVRDGRDVVVSGMAHQRIIHERKGTALGAELARAVAQRRVAGPALERFGAFWEDTCAAADEAEAIFTNFLRLRYEDLLDDTHGELGRLLAFLGADAGDKACDACARAGAFEAMSGGRARGDEDLASVVRKGVAGDWRNWFSPEQAEAFEMRCGLWLDRHGYDRAGAPAGSP
ncbi:MAG: sulfotransferase domain-containing protein [Phycisphaerales bacterium JB039]